MSIYLFPLFVSLRSHICSIVLSSFLFGQVRFVLGRWPVTFFLSVNMVLISRPLSVKVVFRVVYAATIVCASPLHTATMALWGYLSRHPYSAMYDGTPGCDQLIQRPPSHAFRTYIFSCYVRVTFLYLYISCSLLGDFVYNPLYNTVTFLLQHGRSKLDER